MMEYYLSMSAALGAAVQTGLLTSLLANRRTPAEHARAIGLDPRATERVVDVLVAFGVAAREGEAAFASPEFSSFIRGMPGADMAIPLWAHTTEFLRTGKPFMRMDSIDKSRYAVVVAGLAKLAAAGARSLASQLELPVPPARILDLGCGSGVWSLAIASRYPNARVTGVDRADVLEAFKTYAGEQNMAGRVDTLPGDIETVTLPRDHDVVVIANVIRLYDQAVARQLAERAAAAVKPGATLVVVDALAGGTPEAERARTSYALHLSMRTEQGRVYPPDTVIGWLTAAGIADCKLVTFSEGFSGHAAILGRGR